MKKNKTHKCLNCGSIIKKANYCPHCGQLNTDKRMPLKQFIKDFFGDYFTFDSKFFRSLFPLLTKPGYLTKEYVSGKRVSFIFPLRLYIFTIFLFFFIIAVNTKIDLSYLDDEIKKLEQQTSNIDSVFTILKEYGASIPNDSLQAIKTEIGSNFVIKEKTKSGNSHIKFEPLKDSTTAKSKFGSYLNKKVKYYNSLGKEGAQSVAKEIINQIPKVLFLLLPIFALILKLLYIRNKIFFVEHLVFAVHFHTFIFLMILVAVIFTTWYVVLFTILSIFIYLFLALKNVYRQKIFKTFVKLFLLSFLYLVMLIPASAILMILSIISV